MDEPVDPRSVTADARARDETIEFVRRLAEATPRVWVTGAIVAVNVAVFLLMVASGVSPLRPDNEDLFRFGADFGPATISGEWWRLLSCTFVHIGVIHIGFNMWALWQSGRLAERFFGNGAFLLLYLASGIGASIASLLWHPNIVSAGASGSIFGVFGGLLAVVLLHRREIPPTLFRDLRKSTITVIAYNVLIGSAVPGIDNAAHLGGLATGFALGICLRRPLPEPRSEGDFGRRPGLEPDSGRRFFRALPVLVLVVASAAGAKFRVEATPEVRSGRHFDLAVAASEAGDGEGAMKEIETWLAVQPDDPRGLSLRGTLRGLKGDLDGAAADWVKASGLAPDYPYPRKRLGWARQEQGDLDAAHSYFTDVIRLDGEDAEAYAGRGWVRMQQGRPEPALADLDEALELAPGMEIPRTFRPYVLYDLQRWPEALAAFRDTIAARPPEDRLPELFVWAIRARTGEAEAAAEELKGLASSDEDEPRARIAAYLLGGITEAKLVGGARASTDGRNYELCEAQYFIGVKNLLEGDRGLALLAFQRAVETRAILSPACSSAAAEKAVLVR